MLLRVCQCVLLCSATMGRWCSPPPNEYFQHFPAPSQETGWCNPSCLLPGPSSPRTTYHSWMKKNPKRFNLEMTGKWVILRHKSKIINILKKYQIFRDTDSAIFLVQNTSRFFRATILSRIFFSLTGSQTLSLAKSPLSTEPEPSANLLLAFLKQFGTMDSSRSSCVGIRTTPTVNALPKGNSRMTHLKDASEFTYILDGVAECSQGFFWYFLHSCLSRAQTESHLC